MSHADTRLLVAQWRSDALMLEVVALDLEAAGIGTKHIRETIRLKLWHADQYERGIKLTSAPEWAPNRVTASG